jgi:hypothetical protein
LIRIEHLIAKIDQKHGFLNGNGHGGRQDRKREPDPGVTH